jgi:hypothetical protein
VTPPPRFHGKYGRVITETIAQLFLKEQELYLKVQYRFTLRYRIVNKRWGKTLKVQDYYLKK